MVTPTRLILPPPLRHTLETHARACYPAEACGLLVGTADDCGEQRILRIIPARNIDDVQPLTRYLVDPEDHCKADEDARGDGLDVVGVWHSHPQHAAATVSDTDRAHAWTGWSYVIVALDSDEVRDLRAFSLAGGDFVELEIVS
jgi:proteasome lid subunit RPN8/RPN11